LLLGALLVAAAAGATGVLAVWQDRRELEARAAGLTGGDPHAGREAIAHYGCGACHTVPGVRRAQGMVGPPLIAFAKEFTWQASSPIRRTT
jgi:cytochrome c